MCRVELITGKSKRNNGCSSWKLYLSTVDRDDHWNGMVKSKKENLSGNGGSNG